MRPCTSGTSITTWRSKRPGRSSAGSRMSGRLVAPITTRPPSPANPSISTRIWLSVCSRSSLPCPMPAPRLRPAASSSSMKMIAGDDLARLAEQVAHARRSHADERLDEVRARQREEGRVGFAGHRLGEQRLAGARRTHQQHALGRGRAHRQVLRRVGQVVADLAQLGQRFAGARDIGEGDLVARSLALLAPLAGELREAGDPARRAAFAAQAHEQREQADQQQDRDQELDDDRLRALARLLIDRDVRAAFVEFAQQLLGQRARGWVGGPQQARHRDGDRGSGVAAAPGGGAGSGASRSVAPVFAGDGDSGARSSS